MPNHNVPSNSGRPPALPLLPPGTPAWVNQSLVERTIAVWQPHYPDPLTPEQIIEMILAVGWLFDQRS